MTMRFDCGECKHQDTEVCEDCSNTDVDASCTCFNNPPCSFCTDNHFEEKRPADG